MWKRSLAAVALLAMANVATPSWSKAAVAAPARFDTEIAAAKAAMMADPQAALLHAKSAIGLVAEFRDTAQLMVARAKGHWLEAEALVRLNRPQEAKPIIEQALGLVSQYQPGSKLHGDILVTRATLSATIGKTQEALSDFHRAHRIFQEVGEPRSQSMALQYIGMIYYEAADYERVLKYYSQAAEVFNEDPALSLSLHNNIGNTLKELKRFHAAELEYEKALRVARLLNSPLLEVRILTNIASAQFYSGKLAAADATTDTALRKAGIESADWKQGLYGVKAQVALARSDVRLARQLIEQTFAGTDIGSTTMPYREFHDTAYKIYVASADKDRALAHLEAFKRLEDEAREVRASANSALMAARFDFANQELRISKLKAGQLQRDILLARSKARMNALILYGVSGSAAIIIILVLFAYFSIRRSRNEVRAANLELSDTNVALQKALKAKTEFLATTSHEIRTPLNGILGMTQIILCDSRVDKDIRERIELVHGAGETMKALVDDLLDVAKIEKGKLTLEKSEVDVRRVVSEVTQLWLGHAESKGLDLTLDLGSCPDRIVEDERRLRQILFNLVSNAVKFTPQGSIRVATAVEEGRDGERLALRVTDTGIGIAPEHFEDIFASFHQVDGGTTRQHSGTGLGLSICRDLARAMGGDVIVESEVGIGSTFTVLLPFQRAATAVDDPTAAESRPADRPRTLSACSVLVVERNPLAQSIVTAVLGDEVASLEFADDAASAAEALTSRPYHHVIIDMDVINAAEDQMEQTTRLVEAAPPGSITALCAADDVEPRAALLGAAAAQVLAKPMHPIHLLGALKSLHAGSEDATDAAVAAISFDTAA